ncbi:hypothetical protein TRICI_001680 [Trichomonascus ciferrii]|uniref:Hydrophobin n=1 Tax=Trichomonascus ciferrii TaxID=44093 RepID=A0A642V916_9ASCO|nr:hypothetical protein TRICI_001680 [Trichomonascus ciferrii]
MKFFNVALLASTIVSSVFAAPADEKPAKVDVSKLNKFQGVAKGTIDCDPGTKVCRVTCGESLQALCTLVGVVDSAFYGLETLIGFTIHCTEKGCNVYCPVDGTVLCALNEAGAAIDSVFAVGETIIIDGVQSLLSGEAQPLPESESPVKQ